MNEQTELLQSFLTFRLGDEIFAANVSKVLEILEIPKITRVPRSPAFMRGVINLRGSVLPVIDMRAKFGLPTVPDTVNSCIVVMNISLEAQTIVLGAVVDDVQEVMEIEPESIQAAPTVGTKYRTGFIEGMTKLNDQFIMILNLDLVFSDEEAILLQEISESDVPAEKNK
ncbi:MAG TPA: chemotaxis protein CheW [Cyclobacteriaceae bacterium]|nr:chemotaxis protein CheW [Cyclobacteriaceae bacterium]